MIKIAINGFGRIGRLVFRKLIEDKNLDIIAINDLANIKTLAHLLKYDSAHKAFKGMVSYNENSLIVNGKKIYIFAEKDAIKLPWKKLSIEAVVESTGFYTSKELAQKHIEAGAKKVIISAPAKGDIKTIVYSVNEDSLNKYDQIISASSCTTNALAPITNVLHNKFGIIKGFMTTVHSYTADQKLQDGPHHDLRRARAAASNIVPTTTGAAISIGQVIPKLNGKLDGISIRVPTITASIIDIVVELQSKKVTIKDINQAMLESISPSFGYTNDPIVSSDIIGDTHGTIFDSLMTKVIVVDGKKLFKLFTWYDNELSYVSQYVRTFKYFLSL